MIVIVCLDDKKGMMFNHRRQSRDKAIVERVREICEGKRLWMNAYSESLFGGLEGMDTVVNEDFLSLAGDGEVCLVESENLAPFAKKIEEVIVYWWNRMYPADFYLELDLSLWTRIERHEFTGFSHEKITEEIYGRRGRPNEQNSVT